MKNTIYGYVGNGKLGSLLGGRPNFVHIDCDITNINSIRKSQKDFEVVVNLAAISSVDECQKNTSLAHRVNIRGANNLMDVYGDRVLNISSDYVFGGWNLFPPTEKSVPNPLNVYGMTKMAMENFANHYGAKVLRLSRTIDQKDADLSQYFHSLYFDEITPVPAFFHRNYLTRKQAVDGIEYAVRNFKKLPGIVNYGADRPYSFYSLMLELANAVRLPLRLIQKRNEYNNKMTPRPKKAGFSTRLAKSLGFPMYDMDDVVKDFWGENA